MCLDLRESISQHIHTHTLLQPARTWCVVVEVAVASLCVGGVDAQLSEGGGQVPRAAPPAQRRGSWVARLVLVKWCWQWGGEVEAGQVRQGAAGVEGRWDAVSRRGRLLRGRKDAESKQRTLRSTQELKQAGRGSFENLIW